MGNQIGDAILAVSLLAPYSIHDTVVIFTSNLTRYWFRFGRITTSTILNLERAVTAYDYADALFRVGYGSNGIVESHAPSGKTWKHL
jgi:hypothetical protein